MQLNESDFNLSQLVQNLVEQSNSIDQISSVLDQLPFAITLTNTDARIEYVNHQFCQVTGYSRAESIGQSPSFLSYKTTPKQIYEELWADITSGQTWSGNLVNRKQDGSRYLAKIQIFPISDTNNSIVYYLGIQQDISESYEQKIRLKNQNQIIGSVLNTLPSAIALLDENQQVILDNLAYKTLATDLQKEPVLWVLEQLRSVDSNPETKSTPAYQLNNKKLHLEQGTGQSKRVFECQFMALEMNDDLVDHYFTKDVVKGSVLVINEFTREHRLREKQRIQDIRQFTQESESICIMQETITAALHQLLSPMNVLDSALSVMQQKERDAPALSPALMAMKLVRESGQTAINQLRTTQPKNSEETRQSVNLNQLIHETVLIFSERLMKKGIDLKLDLKSTLPRLSGQPAKIRVAIKQVIDNAIDAIEQDQPTQRIITIASSVRNQQVRIQITDTGKGVEKSDRIRIFHPFYSTRMTSTNSQRNSSHRGMGLSITQQIMNDHFGMIELAEPSAPENHISLIFPTE